MVSCTLSLLLPFPIHGLQEQRLTYYEVNEKGTAFGMLPPASGGLEPALLVFQTTRLRV